MTDDEIDLDPAEISGGYWAALTDVTGIGLVEIVPFIVSGAIVGTIISMVGYGVLSPFIGAGGIAFAAGIAMAQAASLLVSDN